MSTSDGNRLDTIRAFLDHDPIAVVGVHRDARQFSNSVYRQLRDSGRTMIPVHPEAETIEGDRCVTSVADLPDAVRAVLVMVKADAAVSVVDDCIARGIDTIWLHRGAGQGAVSDAAVERCRAAGVAVVDGACPLMFLEPVRGIHRLHRFMARRRFAATA